MKYEHIYDLTIPVRDVPYLFMHCESLPDHVESLQER
jgi:hypothetical protein